jgi:hypothetical protein
MSGQSPRRYATWANTWANDCRKALGDPALGRVLINAQHGLGHLGGWSCQQTVVLIRTVDPCYLVEGSRFAERPETTARLGARRPAGPASCSSRAGPGVLPPAIVGTSGGSYERGHRKDLDIWSRQGIKLSSTVELTRFTRGSNRDRNRVRD